MGAVCSIEESSSPQNLRVPIVLKASKSAGGKGDVLKIYGFVHPLHRSVHSLMKAYQFLGLHAKSSLSPETTLYIFRNSSYFQEKKNSHTIAIKKSFDLRVKSFL